MSYLDLPRIHFGGLFYTDPSTINNWTEHYTPYVRLKDAAGNYLDQIPPGRNWNPTGASMLWFEACRVLSIVDPDGKTIDTSAGDPLVGAVIESASPTTPLVNTAGGYRGIAKLVDLDPDEQGRSAVWGLWIAVKVPGGGGFTAKWETPNLRDLFVRGNGGYAGYMQIRGGSWKGRLSKIEWTDSGSPILRALRKLSPDALDLKLTVDLYQRERSLALTDAGQGNRFGYGRLMGTIGPVGIDEPVQIAPGRQLQKLKEVEPPLANQSLATGKKTDEKDTANLRALAPFPQPEWNHTPFVVRKVGNRWLCTIDLGGTIPLTAQGKGKMDVGGIIALSPQGGATFQHGTITIGDESYVQVAGALDRKNSFWLPNAGVFQFELLEAEAKSIEKTPVTMRVGATVYLKEADDGLVLAIDPPVLRMEPNGTNQEARIVGYEFGVPLQKFPAQVTLLPQVRHWEYDANERTVQPNEQSTADLSVNVEPNAAPAGYFRLTIKTGPPVQLPPIREPLDSQVYTVGLKKTVAGRPKGVMVEDHTRPLTILAWQNHFVVPNPTWENSIGKILDGYARLYPGMKGRLDIGDKATVRGFVNDVLDVMTRSLDDPAYMPVVRDLSPTVVDMIVQWLSDTASEMDTE